MARERQYATNAERQAAYRERKRNAVACDAFVAWGDKYGHEVASMLAAIAEMWGYDAARSAARVVDASRPSEWTILQRELAGDLERGTPEARLLKLMLARRDPRLLAFVSDCLAGREVRQVVSDA